MKTFIKLFSALIILTGAAHAQMFWNHAAKLEGGLNSYIASPHTAPLSMIGSFTMEAWVYPTTSTGIRYIIWKGSVSAGYYLRLNSNSPFR
jgi:multidrug transporter EmrE-like cation transporter